MAKSDGEVPESIAVQNAYDVLCELRYLFHREDLGEIEFSDMLPSLYKKVSGAAYDLYPYVDTASHDERG